VLQGLFFSIHNQQTGLASALGGYLGDQVRWQIKIVMRKGVFQDGWSR